MLPIRLVSGRAVVWESRCEPDALLQQPENRGAPILVVGNRVVWEADGGFDLGTLLNSGVRAVIACSLPDSFADDAPVAGLVLITLPAPQLQRLSEVARTAPLSIDLEVQAVTTPLGDCFPFALDTAGRQRPASEHGMAARPLADEAASDACKTLARAAAPWLRPVPSQLANP